MTVLSILKMIYIANSADMRQRKRQSCNGFEGTTTIRSFAGSNGGVPVGPGNGEAGRV